MILYTLLVLFLLSWIRYVWLRWDLYSLAWKLPGPFAWPLIGNALEFLCPEEDTLDVIVNLAREYGSPMRLWMGPRCLFIFTDTNNVEKIMSSGKFVDKDTVYDYIKDLVGEGLITSSGLKWKRDRRLLNPMFVQKSVNEYFPVVKQNSKRLVSMLKKYINKDEFPVDKYLHRAVSDIVNESIIGVRTDSYDGARDDFLQAISRLYVIGHNRMVKVWLQPDLLFKRSYCYKEYETYKNIFHDFMRRAVDAALQRTQGSITYSTVVPLIDQILAVREEHPWFATDEELVHHLCTLYAASEDTVMQICSFALVMLAMHPLIQNKVADEIKQLGGRDVELEDLDSLVYLDRCIKDVLRLFPIGPLIGRRPCEDVTLGDIIIPKDSSVIISIQNIHRDSTLWERPNEFYPDHFLPEAVKNRHPYAFIPFSAGRRNCIGKSYAYMTMKTILVTFLQNYIVETDRKFEDIRIKTDISVRFRDDCYDIRVKERL